MDRNTTQVPSAHAFSSEPESPRIELDDDGAVLVCQGVDETGNALELRTRLDSKALSRMGRQLNMAMDTIEQAPRVLEAVGDPRHPDLARLADLHIQMLERGSEGLLAAELIRRFPTLAQPLAETLGDANLVSNVLIGAHMLHRLGMDTVAAQKLRHTINLTPGLCAEDDFAIISDLLFDLEMDAEEAEQWTREFGRNLELSESLLGIYYASDERRRRRMENLGQGPAQIVARLGTSHLLLINQMRVIDLVAQFSEAMVDEALVALEQQPGSRATTFHWLCNVLVEHREKTRTLRLVEQAPVMAAP